MPQGGPEILWAILYSGGMALIAAPLSSLNPKWRHPRPMLSSISAVLSTCLCMKRHNILFALLALLSCLHLNQSWAQARLVMSGDGSILGICNNQLLLTGRLGPVTNGILRYNGRRVSVAANFSRSGRRPVDPWVTAPRIPAVPDIAPVLMVEGRTEALATTCGSLATTKTVISPFLSGGLHHNYVVSDGKLIVSRVNQRSIDLFSVVGGRATLLGSAPTMKQSLNRPVGGEVYRAASGFVLRAPHPDTKMPILWKLTAEGFQPLSTFPELVATGYTFIRVLKFDTFELGGGSLAIKVSARSPAGQEQAFVYVTDGSYVQQLTESVNYVLPLSDKDGFLTFFYDPAVEPGSQQCKVGLFTAPGFAMQDITPEDGLVAGDPTWCLDILPQVTSGASLFFTHRASPRTLQRFNANTGAVTTVLAADAPFERGMYFLHNRLFFTLVRPAGEYSKTELWVSDGTTAGTTSVSAGGRPLLGADPRRSILHQGEMYTEAYTKLNSRSGAVSGNGVYRFPIPVGPVSD